MVPVAFQVAALRSRALLGKQPMAGAPPVQPLPPSAQHHA